MRWLVLLALLLAACQPTNPQNVYDPSLVQWDHQPQSVVFRADVLGGEGEFRARNAIPNCTIFGDNHVVWVNELGPFQIEVLEDRLADAVISGFAQYLAVNERIYTFETRLPDAPVQAGANPVVETVTINVNGVAHRADSLSGWDAQWFPRVLNACKSLSKAPVLVLPSSGWLSAQSVPFSMQPPLVTWDSQALGVSLSAVTGDTPRWVSGEAVNNLWKLLHSLPSSTIFGEGTAYYQVALQVPGITRDAPPAPAPASSE